MSENKEKKKSGKGGLIKLIIVVYCAACRQYMMKAGGNAWHILDLVWGDVVTSGAKCPEDVLSSPLSAWKNRYKSKKKIKAAFK